jgi:hypothetical protein
LLACNWCWAVFETIRHSFHFHSNRNSTTWSSAKLIKLIERPVPCNLKFGTLLHKIPLYSFIWKVYFPALSPSWIVLWSKKIQFITIVFGLKNIRNHCFLLTRLMPSFLHQYSSHKQLVTCKNQFGSVIAMDELVFPFWFYHF